MNLILLIQIAALICLFFSAFNLVPSARVSWLGLGMCLWLLSLMIGGFWLHTTAGAR